jgi:uncharacterized protein (TIGR02246 family)
MRSIWLIPAFAALGLTTAVSAQGVDQNTRQQVEQLIATFSGDWNKQDAAGMASLFTTDGVLVVPDPKMVYTGPQVIEQHFRDNFKSGESHNQSTVEQVWPLETGKVIAFGAYHLTGQAQNGPIKVDGHWTAVDVRDGGTWKIRLLTALHDPPPAASAQQVDQNTRQQIERIMTAYRENWNKQDPAGIAGLYTKDGVLVTQGPTKVVKTGQQDIVEHYETLFKTLPHNDGAPFQLSPFGADSVIALGEYHLSGQGQNGPMKADGHYTAVFEREGGTWKIRLLTAVPNPPPAAPAR